MTDGFFSLLLLSLFLVLGCSAHARNLRVSASSAGAYEADLVFQTSGWATAWYDTRHGEGEIYCRFLQLEED